MLAVVQDDEHALVGDIGEQRRRDAFAGAFFHAHHLGHGLRHQRRVRQRRQLDQPHAIGVLVQHLGTDLQRQAALADAAHAQKSQEPRLAEQPPHLGELTLAPDEAVELLRQVVRRRLQRAQRRESRAQLRVLELKHLFGPGQIAQPHPAQVDERRALRQAALDAFGQCFRQQRLPAMRRAHDSRGAVHRGAEEVTVARLDQAHVQTAANAQRHAVAAIAVSQAALQLQGGRHRGGGIVEHGVDAVARGLDQAAALPKHAFAGDGVVARQRRGHPRGLLLPKSGAAFDVGEQDRQFGLDGFGHARIVRRTSRRLRRSRRPGECGGALPRMPRSCALHEGAG